MNCATPSSSSVLPRELLSQENPLARGPEAAAYRLAQPSEARVACEFARCGTDLVSHIGSFLTPAELARLSRASHHSMLAVRGQAHNVHTLEAARAYAAAPSDDGALHLARANAARLSRPHDTSRTRATIDSCHAICREIAGLLPDGLLFDPETFFRTFTGLQGVYELLQAAGIDAPRVFRSCLDSALARGWHLHEAFTDVCSRIVAAQSDPRLHLDDFVHAVLREMHGVASLRTLDASELRMRELLQETMAELRIWGQDGESVLDHAQYLALIGRYAIRGGCLGERQLSGAASHCHYMLRSFPPDTLDSIRRALEPWANRPLSQDAARVVPMLIWVELQQLRSISPADSINTPPPPPAAVS